MQVEIKGVNVPQAYQVYKGLVGQILDKYYRHSAIVHFKGADSKNLPDTIVIPNNYFQEIHRKKFSLIKYLEDPNLTTAVKARAIRTGWALECDQQFIDDFPTYLFAPAWLI